MDIKGATWFAAGPEIQRALRRLSDGAFRLYFYICLNASRKSGRISISYSILAQSLGRSRRSIASHVKELQRLSVCEVHPAVNQHQHTQIEVCDDYWPYTKSSRGVEVSEFERYISAIKEAFGKRACIQSIFTGADEKYAATLFARHVAMEQIQRAIALGCCRKYVSLLNGTDGDFIFSFAYFRDVVEEVCDPKIPVGYWAYVMPELENLERKWFARHNLSANATFAPASSPKNKETG
jgi:biotin operon repressor